MKLLYKIFDLGILYLLILLSQAFRAAEKKSLKMNFPHLMREKVQ
ncbi:hypothetical protein [Kaistella jeonii]|nr:hypothetical protein [Kaistella jeonii]SFB73297.1 hypothetical protein SAMN05421876_101448 [Kaistella jeonii]VEI95034.1 Uncharacterised protein [Kaistella jeonii]